MAPETDADILVEDIIAIDRPREFVFDCFWDPRRWQEVAPHVLRVEVLDDQADYQKFRMTIRSDGAEHESLSERIAERPSRIRYEQLCPPTLLKRHGGDWLFDEDGGSTRVTLRHRIRIDAERCQSAWPGLSPDEITDRVKGMIRRNALATLNGLKAQIEAR